MGEHPSPEKLELFLQDKLTADEAVEILLHLEDCQICSKLMPDKTSEEMQEIFFRENDGEAVQS